MVPTITTTMTVSQKLHAPVTLRLKGQPQTFEEKLKSVLQEMKEAAQTLPAPLNEGMLQLFTVLETQFFEQFKESGATDQEKIANAKRLCALFCRVEDLTLFGIESVPAQIVWLGLTQQLKMRLTEILPANRSVDKFITTYRQFNKIIEMRKVFQQIRDQLYLHANSVNEELMTGFNSIQQEMIKVQDATTLSTQQVYERMDQLTKEVTKLFQDFGGHMKEMKTIADLLQLQGHTLGNTLNEAEKVLNKV